MGNEDNWTLGNRQHLRFDLRESTRTPNECLLFSNLQDGEIFEAFPAVDDQNRGR